MENALTTTHNLDFETALYFNYYRYRVGTCHGLWGVDKDYYYILAIKNEERHNGHLEDVFQWFEYSCKRDNYNLIILEIMNKDFYRHLIEKRGFVPLDKGGANVVKIFNKKAYRKLLEKRS
ncbi:MAG: hypothetical protein FWD66_01020 [Paludibacter sp.]|nr:hypothetical protein [Paludibacter sp.]